MLIGLGYQEIITITHVDAERRAVSRGGRAPARIGNPLAEDAP